MILHNTPRDTEKVMSAGQDTGGLNQCRNAAPLSRNIGHIRIAVIGSMTKKLRSAASEEL
jgi:hypothetical protein